MRVDLSAGAVARRGRRGRAQGGGSAIGGRSCASTWSTSSGAGGARSAGDGELGDRAGRGRAPRSRPAGAVGGPDVASRLAHLGGELITVIVITNVITNEIKCCS